MSKINYTDKEQVQTELQNILKNDPLGLLQKTIEIDFEKTFGSQPMNPEGKREVADIVVKMPDGKKVVFFIDILSSDKGQISCKVSTNNNNQTTPFKVLRGQKR